MNSRKPEKPKRFQRYKQKDLSGINSMMSDLMQRHGIKHQVTAAMLVVKANEFIQDSIENHAKNDIKALSFKNEELLVACRHSAAVHVAQELFEDLLSGLLRAFPDIRIKEIKHRLDPKAFEERF